MHPVFTLTADGAAATPRPEARAALSSALEDYPDVTSVTSQPTSLPNAGASMCGPVAPR